MSIGLTFLSQLHSLYFVGTLEFLITFIEITVGVWETVRLSSL